MSRCENTIKNLFLSLLASDISEVVVSQWLKKRHESKDFSDGKWCLKHMWSMEQVEDKCMFMVKVFELFKEPLNLQSS
jgi:hypothetical protein